MKRKIKNITAKYINIPIYLSLIIICTGIVMMILNENSGGIMQSKTGNGGSGIPISGESVIFSGGITLVILLIMKFFSKENGIK